MCQMDFSTFSSFAQMTRAFRVNACVYIIRSDLQFSGRLTITGHPSAIRRPSFGYVTNWRPVNNAVCSLLAAISQIIRIGHNKPLRATWSTPVEQPILLRLIIARICLYHLIFEVHSINSLRCLKIELGDQDGRFALVD